eukprot:6182198-Pleurochrysis_carterae.AAC.1
MAGSSALGSLCLNAQATTRAKLKGDAAKGADVCAAGCAPQAPAPQPTLDHRLSAPQTEQQWQFRQQPVLAQSRSVALNGLGERRRRSA